MNEAEPGSSFLAGGGEMGILTRAYDWTNSSLGAPEAWPLSLQLSVQQILNSGFPMFIWWGPDLIQFYNDAYRKTMGPERHPSALGQKGRECWAEIWDIIGPLIEFVRAAKGSTWHEDELVPVTRHGRRENVWWTFSYAPIFDSGAVGGVLVICNDVTEEHRVKDALLRQRLHFEHLFQDAPGFIAVLREPDHKFEMTNAAFKRLLGTRDYIGRSVRDVVPEVEGQGFYELLDKVYQTGKAHIGSRSLLKIQPELGLPARDVFVDFIYQPIIGDNGEVSGILVDGHDVTEHVLTERRLQLMNDELKHRVKNTLAMVSAIATQTLRGDHDKSNVKAFRERLNALGRAHDVLTKSAQKAAPIGEVIAVALDAHGVQHGRFTINGPLIELGTNQAVSLTLALHELATNASKYGALSTDAGHVLVDWKVVPGDRGAVFHFCWRETKGPPVTKPDIRGFGSQLIERVLAADFDGKVEMHYEVNGLICRLVTSTRNLNASNTAN